MLKVTAIQSGPKIKVSVTAWEAHQRQGQGGWARALTFVCHHDFVLSDLVQDKAKNQRVPILTGNSK